MSKRYVTKMNSLWIRRGRLLAILLVLLIPMSCRQRPLPEVPAFETLGFKNALDVVQRQVSGAYERWQEQPKDPDRNGRLGMLLSTYGKNSAAEIFYQRARILAPSEFRWCYYLAMAELQLGRSEEAVDLFRQALTLDPNNVQARIQLAGLLLQLNELDESVELYREITEEFPKRVEGWLGLGKALDRSGDLTAAAASLQRALNVGPEYGEVHYALAAVLSASGDKQGATRELAAYERTKRNRINSTDPLMQEVFGLNAGDLPHTKQADYYLQRGQLEAAVASFRAAVEINPANQNAWGGLVDSLAKLGKIEETGDSYRAALDAGISYRRLHLTYGNALRKWQQLDAARDVIGKAIELDPQYADALSALGELELQSGAGAEAVEQFRRALAAKPNDRRFMLWLAYALNKSGQYQEAVDQLEPLTTDPAADRSYALKELAIAYHGLDRRDEAIDVLKQSRSVASKSSNAQRVKAIDAMLAEWQKEIAQ